MKFRKKNSTSPGVVLVIFVLAMIFFGGEWTIETALCTLAILAWCIIDFFIKNNR